MRPNVILATRGASIGTARRARDKTDKNDSGGPRGKLGRTPIRARRFMPLPWYGHTRERFNNAFRAWVVS